MAEITPMMKQYLEIKEQNKDSILFFRLGDFYEMFNEDAQLASRELDLTLTTRDRGKAAEDQTPMCGIPYHSSDAYIARLIAKGYKVAICEQTEDPALAKGLVKCDIIRVITPGTVIDSACLDDRRGNFLCGIFLDGQNAGAAFCDMTTGHTHVTAFSGDDRAEHLYNELSRFSPAEAVLSAGAYDNGELVEYLRDKLSCAVERGENRFELKACEKAIRAQFGEERFASLPRNNPAASLALGALLSYLHETQKTDLSYIKDLEYYEQGRFMELDLSARRNLELTETIRAKEKRGSLLWVLDKTKTAMGARNLRAWLTRPLRDVAAIERRLGAVEALTKNTVAREELILSLSGISDMERLIGRIAYGTAGGRDFASLRNSIERITEVKAQLTAFTTGRLHELDNELDTLCSLASVAVNNNYCRPSVDDSGVIEIHDGRHPVVERVLKDALFVPNDTYMGEREDRAAIITGPNMAGKSTYMRQVALITLMAQIGSFVPAKSARIGVVDRIFTRIGASDDLAGGQSTFMVEMTEVSEILHQATPRSLLILDEIGRGTSTFDGMSIARAVLEFCADPKRLGAKTLFATHYHELTELEGILPGVKNYSISIKKRGDELIFLRKIVPGGADRSYGIEVAKLAGLPNEVVKRANVILKELEQGGAYQAKPREETEQVSLDAIGEAEVLAAIRRAQPDTMSPIEAMQLLYELKQKLS